MPLEPTEPTRFDTLLAEARAAAAIDQRRFFVAFAEGPAGFSREDFLETQIQFLFAVVFFAEPMRVLAERLPAGAAKTTLLANIADEAGAGDPAASHEATFLLLLERLGISRTDIHRRALWPEVRAFNDALAGLVASDDAIVALAAFGMIEDCFARISRRIGEAIAIRGFLPADRVVHYTVHQSLDHDHAAGFFDAVRASCDTADGAYAVSQGLGLGAYLLLRFFDDLHDARNRRAWHEGTGTHPGGIGLDLRVAKGSKAAERGEPDPA